MKNRKNLTNLQLNSDKHKFLKKIKKWHNDNYTEIHRMRNQVMNSKSFSNVKCVDENGIIELKSGEFAILISIPAIDIYLSSTADKEIFYKQLKYAYLIPNLNLKCYKFDRPINLNQNFVNLNYEIIKQSSNPRRVALLQDSLETINLAQDTNITTSSKYYWVLIQSTKEILFDNYDELRNILNNLSNPMLIQRVENKLEVYQFLSELYLQNNSLETLMWSDMIDLISPSYLKENINNIQVDNTFIQLLSIRKLPPFLLRDSFLDEIYNVSGVNSCINIRDSVDQQNFIKTLDFNYKSLQSDQKTKKNLSSQAEMVQQDENYSALMMDLKTGNEKLREFNVIFVVKGTQKEIEEKTKILKNIADAYDITLDITRFRQMETWQSFDITTLPLKDYALPQPSLSISASFPFTHSYFADEKGFYLGDNSYSKLPILFDPFYLSATRMNHNVAVVATSGSGKSYLMKKTILNNYARGSKIFILDVESEYSELVKANNGEFINLYSQEGGIINPLQIRLLPSESDDELQNLTFKNCPLAKHLGYLESFFYTSFSNLTEKEFIVLTKILEQLYENFGITHSTTIEELENKSNTEYPTFTDLYNLILNYISQEKEIDELKILNQLKILLSRFIYGTDSYLFNGYTTIDLNNDIICFNLQELLASNNDRLIATQIVSLLTYLNTVIIGNKIKNERDNREVNTFTIVVDEFHIFIEQPEILKFLSQLARRIRKYKGSFLFATQSIQDLIGNDEIVKYARAIFNNCQYSLIGKMKEDDFTAYKELFKQNPLTDTQCEFLSTAEQGNFLLNIDDKTRIPVKVVGTKLEEDMMGETKKRKAQHRENNE